VEQRKLAVDLAEVIVKWECQRMKEEADDVAIPQVRKHLYTVPWRPRCGQWKETAGKKTPVHSPVAPTLWAVEGDHR